MRLLAVTAVAAEARAVLRDLGPSKPLRLGPFDADVVGTVAGPVFVVAGGAGMACSATATAAALSAATFDAVLSLGIAGGFPGQAGVDDVVVADWIVAADLGAQTPAGFVDLEALDLGPSSYGVPAAAQIAARLGARCGPVLTVATVTGTAARAAELATRYGDPAAEAMEGWGVVVGSRWWGLPVYELRAVSNLVGPRDRADWDVTGALAVLSKAAAMLFAERLP